MKKAIVVNPHNDDGIISIGGTLIQLLEKGWKIMYIQMTNGGHGSNIVPYSELNKIRIKESENERKFLGVDKFYNFNIEDGKLGALKEKEQEKISRKMVELMESYNPNIVFLPIKSESHIDHRVTYLFARRAIKKINITPLEVYYLVQFFPFLKKDPGNIKKLLMVPIDDYWSKKEEGIKQHTSQLKEGRLLQTVGILDAYFSLIYFQPFEKVCYKSELLGIHSVNKNYKLLVKDLDEVRDVSNVSHGRQSKKIQL